MENLNIFKNSECGYEIRTIMQNGEPMFVARDVATALEYGKDSKVGMLFKHVPEEWKGVNRISTPGGSQEVLTLSEQGLYFFAARSDKPKAIEFQKWLAGDVVPSIRKHGMYATDVTIEKMIGDPDFAISLLTNLKEERQLRLRAEQEKLLAEKATEEVKAVLEEEKPNITLGKAIGESDDLVSIGDLALIFCQNGYKINIKELRNVLLHKGYIKRDGGAYIPTAKSRNLGIMKLVETTYQDYYGKDRISRKTMVNGKGQKYFIQRGEKIMEILKSLSLCYI